MSPTRDAMTVLMVDDNFTDGQLARIMLEGIETPVNFHYVASVDEGIGFLRRTGSFADAPRPDFVLVDLNMPALDGFDFLAMVRGDEALRATTLIVLTTSEDPADFRRARGLGANMILSKPMDLDDYQDLMGRVEKQWQKAREFSATA